jgi:hypothetical protein
MNTPVLLHNRKIKCGAIRMYVCIHVQHIYIHRALCKCVFPPQRSHSIDKRALPEEGKNNGGTWRG